MLKRTERLRRGEFTTIAQNRAVHEGLFTVRISPSLPTQTPRKFSVVVSKKVAKTAVARNALRRKVYAALTESGVDGVHAIFYMKPDAMEARYTEILSAIERVFPAR
jgi:ribonuclease P protein component